MWIAMQDLMQVALVVACVFAGWSLQTSACSFLLQRMTYPLKKAQPVLSAFGPGHGSSHPAGSVQTVDFTTDHDASDSTEERASTFMANPGRTVGAAVTAERWQQQPKGVDSGLSDEVESGAVVSFQTKGWISNQLEDPSTRLLLLDGKQTFDEDIKHERVFVQDEDRKWLGDLAHEGGRDLLWGNG
ncbi:unnamed protein product [Symbiodinium sp. CCMP2592]|nr:unnamed protein product [Symbiodinium sp. CCMP2592]